MKKYIAKRTEITEIEIVRETKNFVFYNETVTNIFSGNTSTREVRLGKSNIYGKVFDTYEEAKFYTVELLEKNIRQLEERLCYDKSCLQKILTNK